MIDAYYFDDQLRNYILQFCGIFSGLQVQTGKGADTTVTRYTVPVVVGSRDRVVSAIMSGNTQNKPFTIPSMAVYMTGLDMTPERRKGIGVVDRRVTMPAGGVFPNDLTAVYRVVPIPYNMNLELSIYANNTNTLFQILEQVLLLFDPIVQIQTSDSPFDWTKITTVELTGINNEENYPMGDSKRVLVWTLSFVMPIYISAPMDVKDTIVRQINIRLGDLEGFSPYEVDENGELQPFSTVFGPVITITEAEVIKNIH